jgi:hypothetical protein
MEAGRKGRSDRNHEEDCGKLPKAKRKLGGERLSLDGDEMKADGDVFGWLHHPSGLTATHTHTPALLTGALKLDRPPYSHVITLRNIG